MNKLKAFWAGHTITAHSIAAVIVVLLGAFHQNLQFHDLVLSLYGHFSPTGRELISTAIALAGWYWKTHKDA